MKFFIFFIISIWFGQCQYQQTTHLKGEKVIDAKIKSGITVTFVEGSQQYVHSSTINSFHSQNTIGGIQSSVSFFLKDSKDILMFFGEGIGEEEFVTNPTDVRRGQSYVGLDHVWRYSTQNNQWKLLRGRIGEDNKETLVNETPEKTEISSRYGVKGWMEEIDGDHIISLFGGSVYHWELERFTESTNEFWKYNVSSNIFSPIRYFESDFEGLYQTGDYPSGRYGHEIIKINEDEVFLVGGIGYVSKSVTFENGNALGDWWIHSISKDEWKIGNRDLLDDTSAVLIYGETDVYHTNNQIGAIQGHSGILINNEEVMIFGGKHLNVYSNIVHKYNTSSHMWKYVCGNYSDHVVAGNFGREYNETNFPGPRTNNKLFKIADDEVLLFGGFGYQQFDKTGYLNDEWRFNTNENLWKYTGRESSKYVDRYIFNDEDGELLGGVQNYVGAYLEDSKSLLIIGGKGYDYFTTGLLNVIWKVYLGQTCNSIESIDENVCSGHGICVSFNTCNCTAGYEGDFCDKITIIESLNNYLWVFITIPIIVVVVIVIFGVVIIFFSILITKLKTDLNKFNEIEDIELVLEEQKLSRDSTIAHLNINKSLFEIDVKNIKILKKIGQGGGSAVVYSAIWNKQKVAYKCFQVNEFMETEKYAEFEKEVEILASVNFPFILSFYGATMNSKRLGFVMEFAENGDLEQFLKSKKGKKYPLNQKIRMLNEISSAMLYLHNNKIIHRDLKLQNILVTENEETRVMDFGLSKILGLGDEKTRTRKIGTSYFIAPEVMSGHYGKPCDIYSFTMVMFIVLTEDFLPFGKFTLNGEGIVARLVKDPEFRPDISKLEALNVPKIIKEMITQNWDHDSSKRMTFEEISDILKQCLTIKEENNLKTDSEEVADDSKVLEMQKKIDNLEERIKSLLKENEELKSKQGSK